MTARPSTLPHDAPIAKALGLMRTKGFHEVPVLRKSRMIGMITFESIARRVSRSLDTKVEHLLILPPLITLSTGLPEIAEQLLAAGLRAAPVVGPKGELLGLVSRTDIVRALSSVPEITRTRVEEISRSADLVVHEGDECRQLIDQIRLLEEHPLPVLDRKERLVGAVGVADLIGVLWRPVTGGKRDVRTGRPALNVKVGSIMHSPAITVSMGTSAAEAARRMTLERVSSVFVVDGGHPPRVVGQSDLLRLVVGQGRVPSRGVEDVYVEITGLRGSGDPGLLADIDHLVATGLHRIAQHVRPTLLSLHFAPHATHRTNDLTVEARLHTDAGDLLRLPHRVEPARRCLGPSRGVGGPDAAGPRRPSAARAERPRRAGGGRPGRDDGRRPGPRTPDPLGDRRRAGSRTRNHDPGRSAQPAPDREDDAPTRHDERTDAGRRGGDRPHADEGARLPGARGHHPDRAGGPHLPDRGGAVVRPERGGRSRPRRPRRPGIVRPPEEDVRLVMEQANVSREEAVEALLGERRTGGSDPEDPRRGAGRWTSRPGRSSGSASRDTSTPNPPLEILLFRRPPARGRIWVPISGKVEATDTRPRVGAPARAAGGDRARLPRRVLPLDWHVPFRADNGETWRLHAYGVEVARGFSPVAERRARDVGLGLPGEAIARLHFEDNKEAVARLVRHLAAGPSPNV